MYVKNRYFKDMQRRGIAYRKAQQRCPQNNGDESLPTLFSQGQSYAYKYWAIAERMNATEIIVDELPDREEICQFVNTFREAGIMSIVVISHARNNVALLFSAGCVIGEECKVFRKETQLYNGKTEIVHGLRVIIK